MPIDGVIRPLGLEDKEVLRRLLIEADVFTREEIAIALELITIVLCQRDQKDYIINVYEREGTPLGYYCIGPTPATEGTFDLYWIAVSPAAQGEGIGSSLNAHAENLIRSRNGRLVIAETSSQPRYDKTRSFYRGQGYLEVSRVKDYYRVGDDLVVFGKYLT